MNDLKREIQWPRIFAEGTAIVLSILLAFAIDAWWEGRKDAADEQRQLLSLVSEFEKAREQLAAQLIGLESSLGGTLEILGLMGPDAINNRAAEFRHGLRRSFDVGISAPKQSALQDVLMLKSSIASADTELWRKLQKWPQMMGNLEIDGQHLEKNREENFIAALVRLGVPALSAIFDHLGGQEPAGPLQLPQSKFKVDTSILLRDPGFETIFSMRAIRTQILIREHRSAIQFADDVISDLEEFRSRIQPFG